MATSSSEIEERAPVEKRALEEIEESDAKKARESDSAPKMAKRMNALIFGYLGTEYQGLQINPGAKTIESVLHKAIYDAGGIADCNYGSGPSVDFKKISWSRAARTDKGVHALGQVIAAKIAMESETEMIEKINSKLPDDIRIFGIQRVTNKFNAKNAAGGRRYEYLIPSYVLTRETRDPHPVSLVSQENLDEGVFVQPIDPSFRLSDDQKSYISATLQLFVGTKNYHNFTSQRGPTDPSAKRYVTSFILEETLILDGIEHCVLVVSGQSFVLNQIRKMIGLTIYIIRNGLDVTPTFAAAFSQERLAVPIAPALGLMLREVTFDGYNERQQGENSRINYESVVPAQRNFKLSVVYPQITKIDREKLVVPRWVEYTRIRNSLYLQPVDTISSLLAQDPDDPAAED